MEKSLQQQDTDCLRIVIYGPESTGKTTLAKELAKEYQTHWVPEFARDYLQKKWDTKKELCSIQKWADTFQYDHYFLTHIDVPWKADDLRDRPNDREQMYNSFKALLIKKKLSFTVLKGSHESRMEIAKQALKNFN
jgi:HTH-type transcriptional repressor of NAD biosynthesis genes